MAVVLALAASGCGRTAVRTPAAPGSRTSAARAGQGHQLGKASWYGARHQGRPTASGEPFDQHALTAAHRTLPFGSLVRVTNRANGRSVVVRINDRGPHGRGLIIDVSYAAAERLDMLRAGVVPCELEVVRRGR
jgi:rare lipoprotein A